MRTNIEINDQLMDAVMASGEYPSKKAAVEEGLRMLRIRLASKKILALQGKIKWNGDLHAWRTDKTRRRVSA
jgi:antitoxin ParD1/3/4